MNKMSFDHCQYLIEVSPPPNLVRLFSVHPLIISVVVFMD